MTNWTFRYFFCGIVKSDKRTTEKNEGFRREYNKVEHNFVQQTLEISEETKTIIQARDMEEAIKTTKKHIKLVIKIRGS